MTPRDLATAAAWLRVELDLPHSTTPAELAEAIAYVREGAVAFGLYGPGDRLTSSLMALTVEDFDDNPDHDAAGRAHRRAGAVRELWLLDDEIKTLPADATASEPPTPLLDAAGAAQRETWGREPQRTDSPPYGFEQLRDPEDLKRVEALAALYGITVVDVMVARDLPIDLADFARTKRRMAGEED